MSQVEKHGLKGKSCDRWENRDSMKLSNLAEISQLGSGVAGLMPSLEWWSTPSEPGGGRTGACHPPSPGASTAQPSQLCWPQVLESWAGQPLESQSNSSFSNVANSTLASLGNASSLTDFNYEQRTKLYTWVLWVCLKVRLPNGKACTKNVETQFWKDCDQNGERYGNETVAKLFQIGFLSKCRMTQLFQE